MTDLPPDPLDELASAHLDGATTAEEAARIAADPALQARVEALRAVRDQLAGVEPGDAQARAATVAAVLARLDEGATVTALAPVGRRAGGRAWQIVAAAAAVVAVALLIPLLTGDDGSDSQDVAASNTTVTADNAPLAVAPGAEAGTANDASGAPTSTTIGAALPHLGDFASRAALEAAGAGAERRAEEYQNTISAVDVASACTEADTLADRGAARVLGTARLDARPVVVLTDAGGTRIIVLDAATCAVVVP